MISKLAQEVVEKIDGTLSVAESFTGGALCAEIVKIPGASRTLVKGLVCYSNKSKISDLQVPADIIDEFGAVSQETAEYMVKGIMRSCESDYAVATTGNAGPSAEKEGEVGVCYIAVATKKKCLVKRMSFPGDRADVIRLGVEYALNMLLNVIENVSIGEKYGREDEVL